MGAKRGPAKRRRMSDSARARRRLLVQLHCAGFSGRAIASRLRLHEDVVSRILTEPRIQNAISAMHERTTAKATALLEQAVTDAAETLVAIARGEIAGQGTRDRREAAQAILDRRGIVGGQRLEHAGALDVGRMSDAELVAIAATALERTKGTGGDDGEEP